MTFNEGFMSAVALGLWSLLMFASGAASGAAAIANDAEKRLIRKTEPVDWFWQKRGAK